MTDKPEAQEDFIDSIEDDTSQETASINSLAEAEQELDHDALAKFAQQSVAGGDPDDVGEDDVDQRDSGELPAENKQDAADKDADTNKDDKGGDTDTKASDNKSGEGEKAGDQATPADVLARDGKHTIPYSVLEDTRKRLQQQEARNQELEAELEQAKSGGADTKEGGESGGAGDVKLTEAEQAHVDRLREEYGDELADPIEASYLRNARLEQRIESLQQGGNTGDADNSGDDEGAQIQAAIDASPTMAAWQARDDEWYQASQEVYQRAMRTDPEFAAMSMEDRFKALPERVQAAFGKDPSLPQGGGETDTKPADKGAGDDTKAAETTKADESGKGAKQDDTEGFRGTMSDIPGGAAPEGGKFGPVDDASPYRLQQMMDEQADKGNLESFIDQYA